MFHDGKQMTSADVKFTFDRLRDPDVGAATVGLYENVASIEAPDDYTVVFNLENPNPDFLKDLTNYHALIMDADGTDFQTEWNGTGPFMIESYHPEDRMVFKRNPNYWLHALMWVPLTISLCLLLLPLIKGALIGLQWALKMHGFGGPHVLEGPTTAARSEPTKVSE